VHDHGHLGYDSSMRFPFAFDFPLAAPLVVLGVTPYTAHVDVGDGWFDVRFGLWRLRTPLANVGPLHVTGPYNPVRALGLRLSLADRGVTFGTNARAGLCVEFREPVPAVLPGGLLRHPGATVTVRDPERLREEIVRAAA
jgi:hypothetical protein